MAIIHIELITILILVNYKKKLTLKFGVNANKN